ncbi:MAG TPA: hypothetical protein P5230_02420 [Candidatus Magasanikbacteria bacterium]|nr:hypothetical protein [Candidatus Magasanikbacteria bacterium]
MWTFIFQTILVFLAVFFTDVLWVLYVRRVGQGKAFSAAWLGVVIWLFGAYAVISYVDDPRHIVSAALASFIGTYYAVKRDSSKEKK